MYLYLLLERIIFRDIKDSMPKAFKKIATTLTRNANQAFKEFKGVKQLLLCSHMEMNQSLKLDALDENIQSFYLESLSLTNI